jgi:hypothetical protein
MPEPPKIETPVSDEEVLDFLHDELMEMILKPIKPSNDDK